METARTRKNEPAEISGASDSLIETSPWTIRYRCAADWEKMHGDDKRRFCGQCRKFVHNVSAMNETERQIYARPENLHECVFYSRRVDGKVADLSILTRLRRWFPFLRLVSWSALVALLPAALTGCVPGSTGGVRCVPLDAPPMRPDGMSATQSSPNQINGTDAPR
jgi:hypothetical protein